MKNNYKAGRSISRDYSNVTIPCDNTMEIEYSSGANRFLPLLFLVLLFPERFG
jgi:hypothetical protein